MNPGRINPGTLAITSIPLDLEELKEVCCYNNEIKPVILDDDYIGDINSFGQLTLSANIPNDTLDKLLKEVPSNKIYFGVDYGNGIDKIANIQIKKEITNIHRVKKGKRYIIKFDYTNYLSMMGKVNI